MIKTIKNIVNIVKSFITDDLDDDFVPNESSKKYLYDPKWLNKEVSISELKLPHEPIKKDLYNEVFTRQYHTHAKPMEMTEKDLEALEKTISTIQPSDHNKNIDPVLEAVNEFSKPDPIIQQMNDLGYVNPMFSDIKKEIKAGRIDYTKLNYDPNETAQTMNSLFDTAKDLEQNDFAEIKSIVSDLSEKLNQYSKWLLELNDKISNYENRDVLRAVSARGDNGGYGVDLPLETLENVDDEEFFKNKDADDALKAILEVKKYGEVSSITKQEKENALEKFKTMHSQSSLSPNVDKFKNRPSRNVVDELEATLGDKKIKQLSKSYKEKTKTTKTKSSSKKSKKASKSKSKKV